MRKVFESNTLGSHQAIKPLIDACRCIRVNRTPLKRAGNECWSSPSVQYVSPCCPSFPTHISVVHQHHHLDGETPSEATYRTHQEGLKQSDLMSVFRLCLDMWVCGCVCPRVVPLSCVRFQSSYPSTVSTADGTGVCVCVWLETIPLLCYCHQKTWCTAEIVTSRYGTPCCWRQNERSSKKNNKKQQPYFPGMWNSSFCNKVRQINQFPHVHRCRPARMKEERIRCRNIDSPQAHSHRVLPKGRVVFVCLRLHTHYY